MDKLTVGELREQLQEYIDILDDYDDDAKIEVESNTYYVKSQYFMQFGRRGFVDLGNLDSIIDDSDDDDDDEEETEE